MNNSSAFQHLGDFSSADAEKILKRLTAEGIEFSLEENDEALRSMSPFQASTGGMFGSGVVIRIFVASEDEERANAISAEVLGIVV